MNIIIFLSVGFIAGFLGAVFHGAQGKQIPANILTGMVGGLIGGLICKYHPIDTFGFWGSVGAAIVVAGLFVFAAGFSPWHIGRRNI